MSFSDIPVVVSNVKSFLRIDQGSNQVCTLHSKTLSTKFCPNNIECALATHDKFYLRFIRPLACNPRSKKPQQYVTLKSDNVNGLVSVIKPDYDTRPWNCKPFKSWGYDTELFISPVDVGVFVLAQSNAFVHFNCTEVSKVEFFRTMPGTRSFDAAFTLDSGRQHIIENVDKSDLSRLNSNLELHGIAEHCSDSSDGEQSECSEWSENCSSDGSSDDCCSGWSSGDSI